MTAQTLSVRLSFQPCHRRRCQIRLSVPRRPVVIRRRIHCRCFEVLTHHHIECGNQLTRRTTVRQAAHARDLRRKRARNHDVQNVLCQGARPSRSTPEGIGPFGNPRQTVPLGIVTPQTITASQIHPVITRRVRFTRIPVCVTDRCSVRPHKGVRFVCIMDTDPGIPT